MPLLKCETVTPMFLAGADKDKPELRTPSIRGQLRWWFRAVAGGYLSRHLDVRKAENRLFGGTDKKEGAAAVQVRVRSAYRVSEDAVKEPMLPHKTGGQAANTWCIPSGTYFEVTLTESGYNQQEGALETTGALFNLWATLGGMGRRSRRGFGAFQPTDESWNFVDQAAVKTHIEKTVRAAQKAVAEFVNSVASPSPHPGFCSSKVSGYPIMHRDVATVQVDAPISNPIGFVGALMPECSAIKISSKVVLGSGTPRQASTMYVSLIQLKHKKYTPVYTQFYCNTQAQSRTRNDFQKIEKIPSKVSSTLHGSDKLISVSL